MTVRRVEHADPRYIVELIERVTTVSVKSMTMKIVDKLPELELD